MLQSSLRLLAQLWRAHAESIGIGHDGVIKALRCTVRASISLVISRCPLLPGLVCSFKLSWQAPPTLQPKFAVANQAELES